MDRPTDFAVNVSAGLGIPMLTAAFHFGFFPDQPASAPWFVWIGYTVGLLLLGNAARLRFSSSSNDFEASINTDAQPSEVADRLIEEAEWATHNLLNADPKNPSDVTQLQQKQNEWIERVAEKMDEMGIQQSYISRFEVLGRIPNHGFGGRSPEHRRLRNNIHERAERLRGIADAVEGGDLASGEDLMSFGDPSLATGDTVNTYDGDDISIGGLPSEAEDNDGSEETDEDEK